MIIRGIFSRKREHSADAIVIILRIVAPICDCWHAQLAVKLPNIFTLTPNWQSDCQVAFTHTLSISSTIAHNNWMRLTLRTLIAYRSKTLLPADMEAIRQKLSTSPIAQKIEKRINNLLSDSLLRIENGADPNVVSKYLSSDLSSPQVPIFERHCLRRDEALEEVAACADIIAIAMSTPIRFSKQHKARLHRLNRPLS